MIEPTLDWEQVAREAKEIADAHGWNDPPEDDATHAVNVLCELFEAWQLYRAGHEADEPITCEGAGCQMREVCKERCEQYKPYGIAVELADAVLRVLSRTGELRGPMTMFRAMTAADKRGTHSGVDDLKDLIWCSMYGRSTGWKIRLRASSCGVGSTASPSRTPSGRRWSTTARGRGGMEGRGHDTGRVESNLGEAQKMAEQRRWG